MTNTTRDDTIMGSHSTIRDEHSSTWGTSSSRSVTPKDAESYGRLLACLKDLTSSPLQVQEPTARNVNALPSAERKSIHDEDRTPLDAIGRTMQARQVNMKYLNRRAESPTGTTPPTIQDVFSQLSVGRADDTAEAHSFHRLPTDEPFLHSSVTTKNRKTVTSTFQELTNIESSTSSLDGIGSMPKETPRKIGLPWINEARVLAADNRKVRHQAAVKFKNDAPQGTKYYIEENDHVDMQDPTVGQVDLTKVEFSLIAASNGKSWDFKYTQRDTMDWTDKTDINNLRRWRRKMIEGKLGHVPEWHLSDNPKSIPDRTVTFPTTDNLHLDWSICQLGCAEPRKLDIWLSSVDSKLYHYSFPEKYRPVNFDDKTHLDRLNHWRDSIKKSLSDVEVERPANKEDDKDGRLARRSRYVIANMTMPPEGNCRRAALKYINTVTAIERAAQRLGVPMPNLEAPSVAFGSSTNPITINSDSEQGEASFDNMAHSTKGAVANTEEDLETPVNEARGKRKRLDHDRVQDRPNKKSNPRASKRTMTQASTIPAALPPTANTAMGFDRSTAFLNSPNLPTAKLSTVPIATSSSPTYASSNGRPRGTGKAAVKRWAKKDAEAAAAAAALGATRNSVGRAEALQAAPEQLKRKRARKC